MEGTFPKNCFISCSLKDEDARDLLVKKLQNRGVEYYIFPDMKISPQKMVNHDLIDAILSHDALIYVKGGHSALSFWVAFERDYALRSGKHVFSFDSPTLQIEKSRLSPLQLPVYPIYLERDSGKLKDLFSFMKSRHIDFGSLQDTAAKKLSLSNLSEISVRDVLNHNGFIIYFLSSDSLKSKDVLLEIGYALETQPDRILISLLENVRTKDIPHFSEKIHFVQLFGDKKRAEKPRWDDLIVNLYWLVFKYSYSL